MTGVACDHSGHLFQLVTLHQRSTNEDHRQVRDDRDEKSLQCQVSTVDLEFPEECDAVNHNRTESSPECLRTQERFDRRSSRRQSRIDTITHENERECRDACIDHSENINRSRTEISSTGECEDRGECSDNREQDCIVLVPWSGHDVPLCYT